MIAHRSGLRNVEPIGKSGSGVFDHQLDERDAGLRLATLTNSTAQAVEAQLNYAGLRDYFEQVISADEIQCFKPAPEVYHLAARRLSVEP